MLAAALWRYIDDGTLEEFEHCLLHSLTGDVAGDGRIVALAGDLVYLVYEDNAPLRLLLIVVGLLKQTGKYALHVLAHITGLGEHGGIDYGERHVEESGYGPGQQGLAGTGRAHEQYIALLEFDSVPAFVVEIGLESLVMVINGDSQHFLGPVLAYDISVQFGVYLLRAELARRGFRLSVSRLC